MASRRAWYVAATVGLLCVGTLVVLLYGLFSRHDRAAAAPEDPRVAEILEAYLAGQEYPALEITYPFHEALFPPEIVAPTFRWKDEHAHADTWLVTIELPGGKQRMNFLSRVIKWTPSPEQWETIKARSLETEARVSVVGVNHAAPAKILSAASITISTSKDEVGAPLFYREVNLPFVDAVKDPSRIRWRFGEISSRKQPPIVLEKLPVCGNCHSFCADGTVLGLDVDYANDKGSYAIAPVAEEMVLEKDNIITWSDYKRGDGKPTFGLLSQVSPDGKYVIGTVKDRSVFVATPSLEFSQLFFPIRGILAVYRRETRKFDSLPGADDPRFVQSNATWSPDGKTIVFARSKAHPLKTIGNRVLLTKRECREFLRDGKTFLFDLYRIPFNEGKGGQAEPIEGASKNGMSNYFARYSPDGKWIVFCRAKSFMLLQPDSELYIVPAEGGKARRLRCNTARMNSWHSWSPNGKWLVFSSKVNGPYTQLFLTHIDGEGRSTRPVLLSHFTAADRAANIPEFVNAKASAIKNIREQFVDDHSFVRAAHESLSAGDLDAATRFSRKALKLNPKNAQALNQLGNILLKKGMPEEARTHFAEAIQYQPDYAAAYINLGLALRSLGKREQAVAHFRKAIEINPQEALAHNSLAVALSQLGKPDEAIEHYRKAVEINPEQHLFRYSWANALMSLGRLDQATEQFRRVLEINPEYAPAHRNWGKALVRLGRIAEAITQFEKALGKNPNDLETINRLAWQLATWPKDDVRDAAKAVELAEQACKATQYKVPALLDTLAAAYAEAGRFPEAVKTATKALHLVRQRQESLAEGIRRRLELYKAHKPYRQQP